MPTLTVKIELLNLSLWQAIKLRIAGPTIREILVSELRQRLSPIAQEGSVAEQRASANRHPFDCQVTPEQVGICTKQRTAIQVCEEQRQ